MRIDVNNPGRTPTHDEFMATIRTWCASVGCRDTVEVTEEHGDRPDESYQVWVHGGKTNVADSLRIPGQDLITLIGLLWDDPAEAQAKHPWITVFLVRNWLQRVHGSKPILVKATRIPDSPVPIAPRAIGRPR